MPAFDDFLDLVLAAEARKPFLNFLKRISAADEFDGFFCVVLAVAVCGIRRRGSGCQRALGSSGGLLAFGHRLEKCGVSFARRNLFARSNFRSYGRRFIGNELRRGRCGFFRFCGASAVMFGRRFAGVEFRWLRFCRISREFLSSEGLALQDIGCRRCAAVRLTRWWFGPELFSISPSAAR